MLESGLQGRRGVVLKGLGWGGGLGVGAQPRGRPAQAAGPYGKPTKPTPLLGRRAWALQGGAVGEGLRVGGRG